MALTVVSRGGELSVEGGSAESRGADCLGRGEDPGVREASWDIEDLDQQFGGNCWIGAERRGEDPPLVC